MTNAELREQYRLYLKRVAPMPTNDALWALLTKAWCKKTANPELRGKWRRATPHIGQTVVSLAVVNDINGGEPWLRNHRNHDRHERYLLLRERVISVLLKESA